MSELSQIIGLTPEGAAAVHERAVAGDLAALRTFVLHSQWLKIKKEKRYSRKARIEVLRWALKKFEVRIATPEEVEEAEKSSLAPTTDEAVRLTDPRWGDTSGEIGGINFFGEGH